MKPIHLPAHHYASNWSETSFPSVEETNALGLRYAELPDGPAKQDAFLQIAKAFHGYLMKYVQMICRGHVPIWGAGTPLHQVNRDVRVFLRYFLPKGAELDKVNLLKVCRHFHLAFKGMSTDEVYDICMSQLLLAANQYDPKYADKVKRVVEVINERLSRIKQFTVNEVNRHLDFDCDRHVRMLARRGFLSPVQGSDDKIAGFKRTQQAWPPDESFFRAGPIGFTYYLSTWFRYYLQQYIDGAMSQLETQEGVYSLEGYAATRSEFLSRAYSEDGSFHDFGWPDDTVDRCGRPSEEGGISSTLDVSRLTLEWVNSTDDPLFAHLERRDRHLLYLVFAREMDWDQIANNFSMKPREARRWHARVLASVRRKSRKRIRIIRLIKPDVALDIPEQEAAA